MRHFEASKRKIEWADKHISNINTTLAAFLNTDFYKARIYKDSQRRTNELAIEFDKSRFPRYDIALIIGDALHNLRSALDIAWYEIVVNPTNWTRFPIFDTRDGLVTAVNAALEKRQITPKVHQFILQDVKPYKAGNYPIWALHDLNIRDKHQLLVPVLELMRIDDIRFENQEGIEIENPFGSLFLDSPSRSRIKEFDDINVRVKDNGHASATVLFDLGVPFETKPVIPTLTKLSEDATSTIYAFETLLF